MEKISVIIPCRNEENYIAGCLDSVIASDYPKEFTEVFVIDGLSSDATPEIVKTYTLRFPYIKFLVNNSITVPYAMNLGIKESKGDYIIRLDAHGAYPPDYFSALLSWSKKLNADNVGAVWKTEVKNQNKKSCSIKKILSSSFGVGNSYFRIGTDKVREVDTVPFGCYGKEVFEKTGLYNNLLERNQDIELNKRLKKMGGKIFLVPDVYSTYYARETFSGIAGNNFKTGLWNILTVYITGNINSLSIRHFVPLLLCLSLIIPLILALFNPLLILITAAVAVIYLLVLLGVSLKIKDKSSSLICIIWGFIVLHFSYGFGSLAGLFRFDALLRGKK